MMSADPTSRVDDDQRRPNLRRIEAEVRHLRQVP